MCIYSRDRILQSFIDCVMPSRSLRELAEHQQEVGPFLYASRLIPLCYTHISTHSHLQSFTTGYDIYTLDVRHAKTRPYAFPIARGVNWILYLQRVRQLQVNRFPVDTFTCVQTKKRETLQLLYSEWNGESLQLDGQQKVLYNSTYFAVDPFQKCRWRAGRRSLDDVNVMHPSRPKFV